MRDCLEINDIGGLDRYRAVWRDLLAVTPAATFFQSLDWLEVYWRHFGRDKTLRVLLVGDRDRPTGILPLVVHQERRKVGMVRVLSYPLDDWGSFYGPIGANPVETLIAGLTHVKQTEQHWDLLDLRWNPDKDQDAGETWDVMRLFDLNPRCTMRSETAVIDLSGTWEEYLGQRTSKWRNNFRRWKKRLLEAGDVEHIRHRPTGIQSDDIQSDDTDPRWDLYEHCERLAAISWQGASTDGTTLSHDKIRGFLRDAHEVAARAGCLDMNLLSVAGQFVAFAYNYVYEGNVFGLRIGFDPAAAKISPGNMIYAYAIEDSFRRGDEVYDLGPGSLSCKRYWQSSIEPIVQYTHYRPGAIRAQLMKWKGHFDDWRIALAEPKPTPVKAK